MALNPFSNYIDLSTADGLKLYNSAISGFASSKIGKISLVPADADALVTEVTNLSSQFSYQYDITHVPTTMTTTAAADGAPDVLTFGGRTNFLEAFSSSLITTAKKNATITWGDLSFDENSPKVIRELSFDRGEVTQHDPPRLRDAGKIVMRDRMHSKFLAHHSYQLMDEKGRKYLKLKKKEYTFVSVDGRDTEHDGLTVLALLLSRMKPHYMVDLHKEVAKCKALTLRQYGNNLPNYLDAVESLKNKIEFKKEGYYAEDAFIKDLFAQLKTSPVDSFNTYFTNMESEWTHGEIMLTPEQLIVKATSRYTQLDGEGKWVGAISQNEQVVLLTTKVEQQISEIAALKTQIADAKPPANPTPPTSNGFDANGTRSIHTVKPERLVFKGPTIFLDGRTYLWCEGDHWSGGVKYNGMYCNHSTEHHDQWRKIQDERSAARKNAPPPPDTKAEEDKPSVPAESTSASDSKEPDQKKWKLTMSDQLQSVLVTNTNLTPQQFQHLWNECEAEANDAAEANSH